MHHPLPPQPGSIPPHFQPQQSARSNAHPDSPHQNARHFPSPQPGHHSAPIAHQSPYPQAGVPTNGQPTPESFYSGSPYSTNGLPTPATSQFSAAEASEMMAAAQMQSRQYHMYTPQSNSPASAVSSQGPEQPNRIYSQPPQMYYAPYLSGHIPSNSYPQHPSQPAQAPHQMMTSQTSLSPHQNQPPLPHPQANAPLIANSPRSQPKFDASIPRPLDTTSIQRSPAGQATSTHNTPTSATQNGPGAQNSQPGSAGGNPSAAPGPIPATTPLVVRQDKNGVQWIAFEYSRDRVKMEYTIRCDVESVNVDNLSKEFKEANCVYPRAFCEKGKYTGNRLNYETECNTVGWSLVELNPSLKEKRGLIQRAVDSWRNSNQDARLRSRRVRRMNKQTTRKQNQNTNHTAGPRDVSAPLGVSNAILQQRPLPPNLGSSATAQVHPHHTSANNVLPTSNDSVPPNDNYDQHHSASKMHVNEAPAQIRQANVFQGYPNYPLPPNSNAVSIAPPLPNGMEPHISSHPATTIPASSTMTTSVPHSQPAKSSVPSPHSSSKNLSSLYPNLPGKKFINVTDPGNSPNRVRVKLDLRDTNEDAIVDDFRERTSVCPRSYFPHQMRLTSEERRQKKTAGRFLETDEGNEDGFGVGQTTVKLPTLDGETEAPIPRIAKRIGEEEEMLNDLGYRIGWDQLQKFDRRVIFMQRSLDAWRNKMTDHNTSLGQEVSKLPPCLQTRPGKKLWQTRRARQANTASP